ncbi:MAG: tetratricopeptide repeat protein [Bacteroidales bacterium]|nr:tetratricopeptide repeat protein [Bacteroidales bacterium]
METDRFKNYQEDVKQLVLNFEAMQRRGDSRYFDVDQLETIIDFYLETSDEDMLEKSVRYGEKLFPTSNEIRLRRVHLLCFKEKFREAYNLLKQLEKVEPDDTDVLYALGVVYSALEQPRKAIQYYHKAAADGYELGTIYSNIADEYVKMDQREEARNYYRKALKIKPEDERSLYELANCYEDDGMSDKWINFYTRFVNEHPYSSVGWFCLGEGYTYEHLYEKAVDAYQYAIAINADYYYAYMQLSACYQALGDNNNAVATLHDAVAHTQDKAFVYFRIGEIFRFQDNPVTANAYYQKALKEDPYYSEAWHTMSICYSSMREHSAAIEAAKKALKIDPESPKYLTTLAMIYVDSGDYPNANRMFECAIPYFADFEQGWMALADYNIMFYKYEEAIDCLTSGLPECELVVEFNKRLALCYFALGKRNLLFNAVRACVYENESGAKELLDYCPDLGNDIEVMNIIESHRQENQSKKQ